MVAPAKPHLSLVVLGHVDSGKSTTVGHLLYRAGYVGQRTIDKLEREATAMGKASFKYAWVSDRTRAERERAISITATSHKLETARSIFTIIDAPGHRQFQKNTIASVTQADAALLVVAASAGEFETGFALDAQTREHALLAFAFGIKQLVVAVNKMDDITVAYDRQRFDDIVNTIRLYLEQVGFASAAVQIVPISSWRGDNLVDNTATRSNMAWHDGPTLLEALDLLHEPRRAASKPLRVIIHGAYAIRGVTGTVATGRVETGVLTPGMTVAIAPLHKSAVVGSIERHHESVAEARPGDVVGFVLHGVTHQELRRGCVVSSTKLDAVKATVQFTAQLVVLHTINPLRRLYAPIVHCHSAMVACCIRDIPQLLDRRSANVVAAQPESVTTGDACVVVFEPTRPIVLEKFQQYPSLGRIVVRDAGRIVAVGVVTSVVKDETSIRPVGGDAGVTAAAAAVVNTATASLPAGMTDPETVDAQAAVAAEEAEVAVAPESAASMQVAAAS